MKISYKQRNFHAHAAMLTKKELAAISNLRFISRTNFMLVSELSMKKFYNLGARYLSQRTY